MARGLPPGDRLPAPAPRSVKTCSWQWRHGRKLPRGGTSLRGKLQQKNRHVIVLRCSRHESIYRVEQAIQLLGRG